MLPLFRAIEKRKCNFCFPKASCARDIFYRGVGSILNLGGGHVPPVPPGSYVSAFEADLLLVFQVPFGSIEITTSLRAYFCVQNIKNYEVRSKINRNLSTKIVADRNFPKYQDVI